MLCSGQARVTSYGPSKRSKSLADLAAFLPSLSAASLYLARRSFVSTLTRSPTANVSSSGTRALTCAVLRSLAAASLLRTARNVNLRASRSEWTSGTSLTPGERGETRGMKPRTASNGAVPVASLTPALMAYSVRPNLSRQPLWLVLTHPRRTCSTVLFVHSLHLLVLYTSFRWINLADCFDLHFWRSGCPWRLCARNGRPRLALRLRLPRMMLSPWIFARFGLTHLLPSASLTFCPKGHTLGAIDLDFGNCGFDGRDHDDQAEQAAAGGSLCACRQRGRPCEAAAKDKACAAQNKLKGMIRREKRQVEREELAQVDEKLL
ncbi:hypothetical protein DMC30DRAFT_400766 [Rhodotorula diobovata]|uniref:Uncharacterized protein n=1 Tax=Rhodotorula diobovata TaxID=5288 RepID=A0A5C5FSZ2_9BASI|nr:hypothetical protein DMC30DRAFT_400766 [Rhodotorula diobovata]